MLWEIILGVWLALMWKRTFSLATGLLAALLHNIQVFLHHLFFTVRDLFVNYSIKYICSQKYFTCHDCTVTQLAHSWG